VSDAGVGHKVESQLQMLGVRSVMDLRAARICDLAVHCGPHTASALAEMAHGKDCSAVVQSGPPRSITCEDSFKSCSSMDSVGTVVRHWLLIALHLASACLLGRCGG
jgi:nucleotidyltransferase/DNA polymerase involved in DNA repair